MTYNYDLLVIGAGSAGLAAAKQAAKYGAKVAIVEREHLGGVCTNRGCILKKLMVYAADFARLLEDAQGYGWEVGTRKFDWQRFVSVRDQELERLRQVQAKALSEAGVEIIREQAAFLDAHTIELSSLSQERSRDRKITADKVLIAVGGKPIKPDIPGIEHAITSREIFYLPQLPQQIAILGGGYIGVEFASILRGFGVEVTIINREACLLTGFDQDVQTAVRKGLLERGIKSLCNTTAKEIKLVPQGLQLTLTETSAESKSESITADTILCAIGRTPRLENLNLEQAGVEVDKAIAVDAYSRTSQTNIFAAGDCTNRVPLTPVARAEGRAFADTVFGNRPRKLSYDYIPSAVFARPEAASVGMTETQACEHYGDEKIECDRTEFQPLFHSLSCSPGHTLVKWIVQRDSKQILGVHIVGENAAEMIQGIALAIKQGITKQDLDEMIGIHPTSAETFFG
jgi:glutathione reductase (NADPH)